MSQAVQKYCETSAIKFGAIVPSRRHSRVASFMPLVNQASSNLGNHQVFGNWKEPTLDRGVLDLRGQGKHLLEI